MDKIKIVIKGRRGICTLKEGITLEGFKENHPDLSVLKAKKPTINTLEKWASDCICKCPDGCTVEPDGTCQHGWASWLLILGYI